MGCCASQLSADETLLKAAAEGDLRRVRCALDDGANVDVKDAVVRTRRRIAATASCAPPLWDGCGTLTHFTPGVSPFRGTERHRTVEPRDGGRA
jgi:hypothetical protein